jgi:hypothetical protein
VCYENAVVILKVEHLKYSGSATDRTDAEAINIQRVNAECNDNQLSTG